MAAHPEPHYNTLRDLPGVGPSIEDDYRRLGISSPQQLMSANPQHLFNQLELLDGPTDPCILYVFRCAHYAVNATHPEPALLKWWAWKDVEKREVKPRVEVQQPRLNVTTKPSIRAATNADLGRLQGIEDEADKLFASIFSIVDWRPAPSGTERSLRAGYILVVSGEPGSEPLGFAHVLEIPGGDHLEQLAVIPSATRSGYGRALVDAVKAESRLRARDRITLETYADVPWNGPFYASCGFRESAPDTDFLRGLEAVEQQRAHKYGRRVQMVFDVN